MNRKREDGWCFFFQSTEFAVVILNENYGNYLYTDIYSINHKIVSFRFSGSSYVRAFARLLTLSKKNVNQAMKGTYSTY